MNVGNIEKHTNLRNRNRREMQHLRNIKNQQLGKLVILDTPTGATSQYIYMLMHTLHLPLVDVSATVEWKGCWDICKV